MILKTTCRGWQRLFSIADCGDVDILHSDFNYTFNNVTESVKKIIQKGAVPL